MLHAWRLLSPCPSTSLGMAHAKILTIHTGTLRLTGMGRGLGLAGASVACLRMCALQLLPLRATLVSAISLCVYMQMSRAHQTVPSGGAEGGKRPCRRRREEMMMKEAMQAMPALRSPCDRTWMPTAAATSCAAGRGGLGRRMRERSASIVEGCCCLFARAGRRAHSQTLVTGAC